jgi:hypothetical protein
MSSGMCRSPDIAARIELPVGDTAGFGREPTGRSSKPPTGKPPFALPAGLPVRLLIGRTSIARIVIDLAG